MPWMNRTTGKLALLVAAACVMTGCVKDSPRVTAAVPAPATRAQLIAEAQANYSYGAERAAVTVDTARLHGPGGLLPTITIATATRVDSSTRIPGNRFIARLTSTGAYARLGLAPGVNYVWRDTLGPPTARVRLLVVPKDSSYAMYWLKIDADRSPAPDATMPLLLMSTEAYAICDNTCPIGHCRIYETLVAFIAASDTTLVSTP